MAYLTQKSLNINRTINIICQNSSLKCSPVILKSKFALFAEALEQDIPAELVFPMIDLYGLKILELAHGDIRTLNWETNRDLFAYIMMIKYLVANERIITILVNNILTIDTEPTFVLQNFSFLKPYHTTSMEERLVKCLILNNVMPLEQELLCLSYTSNVALRNNFKISAKDFHVMCTTKELLSLGGKIVSINTSFYAQRDIFHDKLSYGRTAGCIEKFLIVHGDDILKLIPYTGIPTKWDGLEIIRSFYCIILGLTSMKKNDYFFREAPLKDVHGNMYSLDIVGKQMWNSNLKTIDYIAPLNNEIANEEYINMYIKPDVKEKINALYPEFMWVYDMLLNKIMNQNYELADMDEFLLYIVEKCFSSKQTDILIDVLHLFEDNKLNELMHESVWLRKF